MGNAIFYHCQRAPGDALVPTLIARARGQDWRVALRGTDPARLDRLDAALWDGDGFLPHGRAGGPQDARQPVLLAGPDDPLANAPDMLILLDNAAADPAEAAALNRLAVVFDGADPAAVDYARGLWRSLAEGGIAAEYWSDADGRWTRKR